MEENIGTAAENGELTAKETQQEKTVPYGRFQEVLTQRKVAESALESLVTELTQDVPEAMRDLIPASLPALERAQWIRTARAKGFFTPPALSNSPDSKRPAGKPDLDLSDMNPMQMMHAGYGK